MTYDKVRQTSRFVVGVKQSTKAVEQGKASEVIIALDADGKVLARLLQLCRDTGVPTSHVDSMKQLGRACGIEVGAAAVALLKDV